MEYYIMKIYRKRKNEFLNASKNKYDIGMNICLFVILLQTLILPFVLRRIKWIMGMTIICLVAIIGIFILIYFDQKYNLEEYAKTYEKRISVLRDLLVYKYNISTKDKTLELKEKYNKKIKERTDNEKKRDSIIITIFAIYGSILSVSLSNLNAMNMNFQTWLVLAVVFFCVVVCGVILTYSITYKDSLKKDYMQMVDELEDIIIKYY